MKVSLTISESGSLLCSSFALIRVIRGQLTSSAF
jgi:hypothetical protein